MASPSTPDRQATRERAVTFRALHHREDALVLPNAWDVLSATIIAARGAAAIATTSAGISWAHGCPDGQHLDRATAATAVGRIASTVTLPVSADVEGGYGPTPDDVAATVEAVLAVGAVGINLEDSPGATSPLIGPAEQGARIAAARARASQSGVELVINARTDVFLISPTQSSDQLDEVIARAHVYAEAGADCLFVPGLLDLGMINALVGRSPLPVNIMAGPGAPTVAQLSDTGVRRISVGAAIAQAVHSLVDVAAAELLEHGTYTSLDAQLSFGELNALAPSHRGDSVTTG